MTELKPCPFCGEESNIYLGNSTDGYIRGTQYVEAYCNKCGARIKRHLVSEAIEAWNKRSNPWHTGTPTENGRYLVASNEDNPYPYGCAQWSNIHGWCGLGASCFSSKDIVKWQKIEEAST